MIIALAGLAGVRRRWGRAFAAGGGGGYGDANTEMLPCWTRSDHWNRLWGVWLDSGASASLEPEPTGCGVPARRLSRAAMGRRQALAPAGVCLRKRGPPGGWRGSYGDFELSLLTVWFRLYTAGEKKIPFDGICCNRPWKVSPCAKESCLKCFGNGATSRQKHRTCGQ